MAKDNKDQILVDARIVASQGSREHDSFPDYVLIEPDAWEAAQRLANATLAAQPESKKASKE